MFVSYPKIIFKLIYPFKIIIIQLLRMHIYSLKNTHIKYTFTDGATLQVNGISNRHIYRISGSQEPYELFEIPWENVRYRLMEDQVIVPYFFIECTIREKDYLEMLQQYAIPKVEQNELEKILTYIIRQKDLVTSFQTSNASQIQWKFPWTNGLVEPVICFGLRGIEILPHWMFFLHLC